MCSGAAGRRIRRPRGISACMAVCPAFVAMLLVVSVLVYVPMELVFGADSWVTLGAFSFQASRLLLYAIYFLAGIQIGAFGTRSLAFLRGMPGWRGDGRFGFRPGFPPMRYGSPSS